MLFEIVIGKRLNGLFLLICRVVFVSTGLARISLKNLHEKPASVADNRHGVKSTCRHNVGISECF